MSTVQEHYDSDAKCLRRWAKLQKWEPTETQEYKFCTRVRSLIGRAFDETAARQKAFKELMA